MSSANKVIICFLGFEYIFPFLFNPVVKNALYYYQNSPQFQYQLFSFIILAVIPCFFFNKKNKIFIQPSLNKKVLNIIFFTNLCIISFYFLNGLSGSRYFGGISERENFSLMQGIAQISFEIASINLLLLIWTFLILHKNKTLTTKYLSAQSVFFISGLNSGLTFFYPVYKNLFADHKNKLFYLKLQNLGLLFVIGILFFVLGLFSKKKSFHCSDFQSYLSAIYLVDRFSTHLYHASSVIALQKSKEEQKLNHIRSLFLKSIKNRTDIIRGKNHDLKDHEKSISGYFNFYFFNKKNGKPPPGGSSIGLFATLCLFLPFPISIFVGFLIFFLLKIVLTLIFKSLPFCNWLLACAFAYGPLRLFTDDPLLLFNPFEPLLISLLIFSFICKRLYKKQKSNASY